MGQPSNNDLLLTAKLSEMKDHEIHQKMQDMLIFTRECHRQRSEYKKMIELAAEIIDCCESELRKRGKL